MDGLPGCAGFAPPGDRKAIDMLQGNFDPVTEGSVAPATGNGCGSRGTREADRATGRQGDGDNDMNKRVRNSFQTLNITSIKMHPLSR